MNPKPKRPLLAKGDGKTLFGLLIVVLGVLLGIYLGLVWAFAGGIVLLVQQFHAGAADAWAVAWGVTRILIAAPLGWLTAGLFIWIGAAIAKA